MHCSCLLYTSLCAVLALHQDLYKVPGDAQHLLDLGHHAVAEQVCLLRLGRSEEHTSELQSQR